MLLTTGLILFGIVSTSAMAMDNGKAFDCPANEIYVECEAAVCQKYCTDLDTPPGCPGLAPGCYMPACVCKDYWLRNNDGICVHYPDCNTHSNRQEAIRLKPQLMDMLIQSNPEKIKDLLLRVVVHL